MGKQILRTTNFFMDLFVKQKIPGIYRSIRFGNQEQTQVEVKEDQTSLGPSHKSFSVALIPDYCNPELIDPSLFSVKTRKQFNRGYSIMFTKDFNLDTYLKKQLKSNYRNLKKRHQRLEHCFNIRYSVYYGSINNEEYLFLMESLKNMLIGRFDQRNDKNEKLEEWNEILANTYDQILEKKASLFVIYDDELPIDISLNYHFDKIMFGAISSYELAYAKFGMGSIEKIKLLDWCQSEGYKILDFGYGDLVYKQNWCNNMYQYKYQVIYNKKSFLALLLAKMELFKLSLKENLKARKVDIYFKRLKSWILPQKRKNSPITIKIEYQKKTVTDPGVYANLGEIAYNPESPFPIKLIVNDFLYTNQEHKDQIVIQEVLQEPGSYLITGEKISQIFNFKN